jgi:hypothetical protein
MVKQAILRKFIKLLIVVQKVFVLFRKEFLIEELNGKSSILNTIFNFLKSVHPKFL